MNNKSRLAKTPRVMYPLGMFFLSSDREPIMVTKQFFFPHGKISRVSGYW